MNLGYGCSMDTEKQIMYKYLLFGAWNRQFIISTYNITSSKFKHLNGKQSPEFRIYDELFLPNKPFCTTILHYHIQNHCKWMT